MQQTIVTSSVTTHQAILFGQDTSKPVPVEAGPVLWRLDLFCGGWTPCVEAGLCPRERNQMIWDLAIKKSILSTSPTVLDKEKKTYVKVLILMKKHFVDALKDTVAEHDGN